MQAPKWKLVHISHLISVQKRGCLHKQRLVSPREENGKRISGNSRTSLFARKRQPGGQTGWKDAVNFAALRLVVQLLCCLLSFFFFLPQVGACGNCICLLVQFFPLMKMSSRSWIHKQWCNSWVNFIYFFNAALLEPFYHVNEEKKINPPKTSENA